LPEAFNAIGDSTPSFIDDRPSVGGSTAYLDRQLGFYLPEARGALGSSRVDLALARHG
jgi:hypothetical protein